MTSVLITAFEPYDGWTANSSWLSLVQLTYDLPSEPSVTTRLYPVDLAVVQQRLAKDLAGNFDFALHLGQAPGSTRLQLESLAINVGGASKQAPEDYRPLLEGGPAAYQSPLPLGDWALMLREAGVPAGVSYHAGTFLCNATLYFSCYFVEQMALRTRSTFVHVPLDVSQTASQTYPAASLPVAITAQGLRLILEEMARGI
jgi:pyroglutamyl-peptidase